MSSPGPDENAALPGPVPRRPATSPPSGPEALVRTCLNCGTSMEERKCKLFCRCGYYASCSDFL